ncbi:MAG: Gfo/Idh/MocA family oxidoreductase, partial [Alphaproteobacteria bacterium]
MKIGIAGFGAIGKVVAKAVERELDGMTLVGISVRDAEKAKRSMTFFTHEVPVLSPDELAEASDVVVECVPKAAFMDFAIPALTRGRLFVTVSGAGILANTDVVEIAKKNNGKIVLATGALLGLDAVRAAAEGQINEIRMVTRKPPNALKGAPHLIENKI